MEILDIIRQLQADPVLKAELRAFVLGEEVLGSPELVMENSRQTVAPTEAIGEQVLGESASGDVSLGDSR